MFLSRESHIGLPFRIKERPLLWVASAFILGTLGAAYGLVQGITIPFVTAIATLLISFFLRRFAVAGLCVAIGAAAALHWNVRHLGPEGDPLSRLAVRFPEAAPFELEATVRKAEILLPEDDYTQAWLDVDRVGLPNRPDLDAIGGGVMVRWTDPGKPFISGERVRLRAPIELDLSRINPDTPSYEDYLRRHDIHAAVRIRGPNAITRVDSAPLLDMSAMAARFRQWMAQRLQQVIPQDALPFVLTVWLGDRQRIGNEAYEAFLFSGAAHILAVSGVHTGIVFVTLATGLRLTFGRRRPRVQALFAMAGVFAFALMAGARIPSLRAATMIALYLASDIVERESDAPTALSIAALVFVGADPDSLFDTGFQLSFLSIASILLFTDRFEGLIGGLPLFLQKGLATSIAVQILPLPVALAAFGVFPLAAPLLNVAIIPMLAGALWLAFLTSIFVSIHVTAGALFGHALALVVRAIQWLCAAVSDVPILSLDVAAPSSWSIGAYILAAAFLYIAMQTGARRRAWLMGAGVSLAATVVFWSPFTLPAKIVFLDVGHGDATFIRTPRGQTILVDAGDRNELSDTGQRVIGPFLRAQHVSRLDYLLLTHEDRDHVGGAAYILDHFDVGEVCLGPNETDSEDVAEVLRICAERNIPVTRVAKGDALNLRGATAEVLHPPRDWRADTNDASVVLRISWPGMRVLLTGDIEQTGEARLVESECRATILKAPHHGSATSSSGLLIHSVDPRATIISAGRRRGGKVVREEVLQRYHEEGVQIFRTDYDGGIEVRVRDGLAEIGSARMARNYVQRATLNRPTP